jgi:dynein heavy chain
LEFYIRLFKKAIKNAEKPAGKKYDLRVKFLLESLKKTVYYEMCRSLFVKHKLLIAFMLTITNLQTNKLLPVEDYQFLLTGLSPTPIDEEEPN